MSAVELCLTDASIAQPQQPIGSNGPKEGLKAKVDAIAQRSMWDLNSELISADIFVSGGVVGNITNGYSLCTSAVPKASDSPGLQGGLGAVSALAFITEGFGIYATVKSLSRAKRVGDQWEIAHQSMMMLRWLASVATTLVMVPIRVLTVMSSKTISKASSCALNTLGLIASSLSVGIYSILAINFSVRAARSSIHLSELNSCTKHKNKGVALSKGIEYLTKHIELNDAERKAILDSAVVSMDPPTKEEYEILSQDDYIYLSEQKLEPKHYLSCVKAFARKKMGKEDNYKRLFGKTSLDLLKKDLQKPEEKRLVALLNDPKQVKKASLYAQEIIDTAKTHAKNSIAMDVAIVAICAMGIASFAISIALTGGASVVISLALAQLASVAMLILDSYSLIDTLKSSEASKSDLALMTITNLIMITGVVVSIVFTAGVPLVATVATGIIFIALQSAIMYNASRPAIEPDRERHMPPMGEGGFEVDGIIGL